MKKTGLILIVVMIALSLSGCAKKTEDLSAIYGKINALAGTFSSDYVSYQVVLSAEGKHISLHNQGTIRRENGAYVHTYTHESLNRIGSGAASLISANSGTVRGTKEEVIGPGMALADGIRVSPLNFRDAFKTHEITRDGDSYVMKGYIARNTIIRYTEGLDRDIRFYYTLRVNSEVTEIELLQISYATTNFDSIVITLLFREEAQ